MVEQRPADERGDHGGSQHRRLGRDLRGPSNVRSATSSDTVKPIPASTATPAESRHDRSSLSSAWVNRVTSQLPPSTPSGLPTTSPSATPTATGSRTHVAASADHHPCGEQREERHREPGGHRREPVLEPLGRGARLVLVGRTRVSSPRATPAMVAWMPLSCVTTRRRGQRQVDQGSSPAGAGAGRTRREQQRRAASGHEVQRSRCRTPR